ncbi:MAG: proteasome subunit beta [Candidatus Pacearchaeota archaeon]
MDDIKKSVLKSGTSIVGIVCKDGIVMAGDRRSTAGGIVLSKRSPKVVKINEYIVISGTGIASDIDMNQRVLAAELKLKELRSRQRPNVKESASLAGMIIYRNIRTPSMVPSIVGLLVAGINPDGSTALYTVEPAGGVYPVEDYDANFSSGMPYILGLLERRYKKDMSVKEGIELAQECIKSSMERDTGSGNGIDVFTITKDGITHVIAQDIQSAFVERK